VSARSTPRVGGPARGRGDLIPVLEPPRCLHRPPRRPCFSSWLSRRANSPTTHSPAPPDLSARSIPMRSQASSSSLVSFAYPSRLDIHILDGISCFFPAGSITFVLPGLPASLGAVDPYLHGGRRELSAGEDPAKGPLACSIKYSLQRSVAQAMHPDTRVPLSSSLVKLRSLLRAPGRRRAIRGPYNPEARPSFSCSAPRRGWTRPITSASAGLDTSTGATLRWRPYSRSRRLSVAARMLHTLSQRPDALLRSDIPSTFLHMPSACLTPDIFFPSMLSILSPPHVRYIVSNYNVFKAMIAEWSRDGENFWPEFVCSTSNGEDGPPNCG
jgi:hypothetical protein